MTLKDDVKRLLGREEHAGTLLADYLAGCLNAFDPASFQQALALRAEFDHRQKARYETKCPAPVSLLRRLALWLKMVFRLFFPTAR